jgi:hypothetical protein
MAENYPTSDWAKVPKGFGNKGSSGLYSTGAMCGNPLGAFLVFNMFGVPDVMADNFLRWFEDTPLPTNEAFVDYQGWRMGTGSRMGQRLPAQQLAKGPLRHGIVPWRTHEVEVGLRKLDHLSRCQPGEPRPLQEEHVRVARQDGADDQRVEGIGDTCERGTRSERCRLQDVRVSCQQRLSSGWSRRQDEVPAMSPDNRRHHSRPRPVRQPPNTFKEV